MSSTTQDSWYAVCAPTMAAVPRLVGSVSDAPETSSGPTVRRSPAGDLACCRSCLGLVTDRSCPHYCRPALSCLRPRRDDMVLAPRYRVGRPHAWVRLRAAVDSPSRRSRTQLGWEKCWGSNSSGGRGFGECALTTICGQRGWRNRRLSQRLSLSRLSAKVCSSGGDRGRLQRARPDAYARGDGIQRHDAAGLLSRASGVE